MIRKIFNIMCLISLIVVIIVGLYSIAGFLVGFSEGFANLCKQLSK